MVKNDFLKHPLIPLGGQIKSFLTIRTEGLTQIVKFCVEKRLLDALLYLFREWYDEKWATIWLRSIREDSVCRYRTSMFAESHFRILKRDFFSQFGRPVIFILLIIFRL
jgi:hypothetical protein